MDKEKNIVDSWQINADNWIDIIENNGIESRRLATNKAIVDAVTAVNPSSVLDIGCGEGWLLKELFDKGISVTGVDVVPGLIEKSRQKVSGHFMIASYEDIYLQRVRFSGLFDAIVINFALLGKESTEKLLASLPAYLAPNGFLFIQTLHPHLRKSVNDYESGWKTGGWDGLGDQFTNSYEWYFRTLEDWLRLLTGSGFSKIIVNEVLHPATYQALSVIFECKI
jgi:2-polyprenyl-3-methyl-5-hydroxy-6-metoxy-1,4-benzoquinol methylase